MRFDVLQKELRAQPQRWLVTGAAGFIGSHLVERLLRLGQDVVGLDNLSTGHLRNIDAVRELVGDEAAARLQFIEGDIRDLDTCRDACAGVDRVLHQAALGSVPRSISDPISSHLSNVDGFLNMLVAGRDAGVRRFVYASSSSVYGDEPTLPKREGREGKVLSPYAATKHMNEVYAQIFQDAYGIECVGLRYFNVFGSRQDPNGPYAAVMPRWMQALLDDRPCDIFGDGETSRDFCYVDNAVQANLLAATANDKAATNQVYNVACADRTTLNQLFVLIRDRIARHRPSVAGARANYGPERKGDIRHSLADVEKAMTLLGYEPTHRIEDGLDVTVDWYATQEAPRRAVG